MTKKRISMLLVAALSICLIGSLCACGSGISIQETQKLAKSCLMALCQEDYETAATYMHPDTEVDAAALKSFATSLTEDDITLSGEMTSLKQTGFQISLYNSTYGGSSCELTFLAVINGQSLKVVTLGIRNQQGTGLYNLTVSKQ